MPDTPLIVPLDEELAAAFSEAAKAAGMSESDLARLAMQDFLMHQAMPEPDDPEAYDKWFREKVEEGIAAADAGEVHSQEDVSAEFAARRTQSLKRLRGNDDAA